MRVTLEEPKVSDAELIERCQERRAEGAVDEAFEALYERHVGVVWAFIRRMVSWDEHLAQDLLQETFARAFHALASFQSGRELRPWLLTIARNACIDAIKKSRPEADDPARLAQTIPDREAQAERDRRELAELLRCARARLSDDEQAVLTLRSDLGLSFEGCAEVLGCSVRTTKYRMKSALERIGRELERLGWEH